MDVRGHGVCTCVRKYVGAAPLALQTRHVSMTTHTLLLLCLAGVAWAVSRTAAVFSIATDKAVFEVSGSFVSFTMDA